VALQWHQSVFAASVQLAVRLISVEFEHWPKMTSAPAEMMAGEERPVAAGVPTFVWKLVRSAHRLVAAK
jgi:hypothetical protein